MLSGEPARRIPTLVHYCQKVASVHADGISSLGNSVAYDLVRPILENCGRDTLVKLEDASPHLKKDTEYLWKRQCCLEFPIDSEPYLNNPPLSWRDQFCLLEEDRQRRFEAAGSRMRITRMGEEERRKERDVKLTDRAPPLKRARGWYAPSQPKTLFQKTRTQASKVQKMLSPELRPPMLAVKSYRVVANTVSAKPPPPPNPVSSGTRVTVKTVVYRQPPKSPPSPLPSQPQTSSATLRSVGASLSPGTKSCPKPPPLASPPAPSAKFAPILNGKKGPASSLFMPKHRAHSQLPNRLAQSRA